MQEGPSTRVLGPFLFFFLRPMRRRDQPTQRNRPVTAHCAGRWISPARAGRWCSRQRITALQEPAVNTDEFACLVLTLFLRDAVVPPGLVGSVRLAVLVVHFEHLPERGHRRESQSRASVIIVFALAASPGGPEIFDIAICTPLTTELLVSVVASFFQEAFTCDMYQSPTLVKSSVDWN
jgi:hypothetical protein